LLPLDDKRWSELTHAYGPAIDIPPKLARLKVEPAKADVTFRQLDLWSALDHQSSVYTATFAAIPHLVDAAKTLPPEKRVELFAFVGCSVADAALPRTPAIPEYLRPAYEKAIVEGTELLAQTLLCTLDMDTTRWLLGAMAALKGHTQLSHVITGLDCFVTCPSCGADIEPMKSTLNLEYTQRGGARD
jgi:hypothetical protein